VRRWWWVIVEWVWDVRAQTKPKRLESIIYPASADALRPPEVDR